MEQPNEEIKHPTQSLYQKYGLRYYPIPIPDVGTIQEPSPPSKEIPLNPKLMEALLKKSLVVVDKDDQTIPEVTEDDLKKIISDGKIETGIFTVGILKNYLQNKIIIDGFVDHKKRKEWRNEWIRVHGNLFSEFYDNNQLRGHNRMALVISYLDLIKEEIKNSSVKEQITHIYKRLVQVYAGNGSTWIGYNEMKDLRQQLAVVSLFELTSAISLRLLKGEPISLQEIDEVFDVQISQIYPQH